MITSRGPIPAHEPLFFYRPYWNEHVFLAEYPQRGLFDVALLRGRHLAPHAAGSRSAQSGYSGRELAIALEGAGAPYVIDPDTAILAAGDESTFPSPRIALMPHAQVLDLPLTRLSFTSPDDRRSFTAAAVGAQSGAQAIVAPYFRFERRGDGWHRLNMALLDDTSQMIGGLPLVAFVYAPIASLLAGAVGDVAVDHARAGVALTFLRIAGFDPQQADQASVSAYRRAIDAFRAAGVPAVADGVGRFGIVLAAGGAAGFSSGATHHQAVPLDAIFEAEQEMRSTPTLYEVPDRWFALSHSQARADARSGGLPLCSTADCSALTDDARSSDLKEHLIHYFTHRVREIAVGGSGVARESLTAYPTGSNHAWISAL